MFRHLGWLVGLPYKSSSKRLSNANNPALLAHQLRPPLAMLDSVQEIAIYIHRFHNLDLFQQGWYQIKITMRREDSDVWGTPARVVQYEAPDLGSDDVYGVWRIDDTDNSFSTQPFRIKYARQDVFLSIMISFNLSLAGYEGQSSSAVLLKFELMHAPISGNRSDLQAALDANPAAVHEFRIPPKALLGLHSYCPVHFDAFHSVLVDISIHISLLKAPSYKHPSKVSSIRRIAEDVGGETSESNQAAEQVASADLNGIMLLKKLLAARSILLEELQTLSKAIDQEIDLTDFISKMDDMNDSLLPENLVAANDKVSGQGKPQNGLEKANSASDSSTGELTRSLSKGAVLNSFNLLGDQLFYLWNTFLQFHRFHKTKMLEYLHDTWAKDRRAEWSIWMVYSKVEMPHHFLNSGFDESSNSGGHRRTPTLWKLNDDPAQIAATRAELHRRSIAQMKINNRSIQDLHIFGDPSSIPIVIVERVMNAPRRTTSENSYLRHLDVLNAPGLETGSGSESVNKQSGYSSSKRNRVLKIVVFVHGFQGHHLDLRLIRNQWLLVDPKAEFLMSEANEDKTSSDFREMGQRLAQEVITFLKKKMDKASRSGNLADIKLSFVGHSIGNVIIRTALTEVMMEPFLRYLYVYVSISGPHLGYLYSSNSLFNSGLWLLKKLKNTQCIHQLTFTDDPDLQNTFFYQLCKKKTLEYFKHIILLSSPQDGYVPYHSARIDMCQAASLDFSKRGKVFLEMLNDCLDQIRSPRTENRVFMRCDINFDTSAYGKNLNTFIGRAAHIDFLESDTFARFIMWSFPDLFR
uniref:protein FAM135B-like isoform X1 n=1 Tax=Fragaria vesca subsp. vesca TaxID=101020 RepID=UPI0005CAC9D8|nr:PREDICTED: protein FAM135B-like isoform X1 [Fragaria vesca subsp. vesca]